MLGQDVRMAFRGFARAPGMTGLVVNGSARLVGWFSGIARLAQTGILNTYAVLMLFGVLAGVSWVIWRFSS
jgi:hypothetical protein